MPSIALSATICNCSSVLAPVRPRSSVSRARVSGVRRSCAMSLPTPARERIRVSISSSMPLTIIASVEKESSVFCRGQSFTQVAGNDALNPYVDLNDTPPDTRAQRHTDRKAKKHSGNQAKRQCLTNDARDLPDFIDISPDHQHVAVGQTSHDQADGLFLPTPFVRPVDHGTLYRIIGLRIGCQTFQVTRDPAAVRAKPSCELNTVRILPQMLIDRLEPPLGRQFRKNADLRGDHTVGSLR